MCFDVFSDDIGHTATRPMDSGRMIDWSALPAHYSKDVTFFGVGRKGEGGVLPNTEQTASVLLSEA